MIPAPGLLQQICRGRDSENTAPASSSNQHGQEEFQKTWRRKKLPGLEGGMESSWISLHHSPVLWSWESHLRIVLPQAPQWHSGRGQVRHRQAAQRLWKQHSDKPPEYGVNMVTIARYFKPQQDRWAVSCQPHAGWQRDISVTSGLKHLGSGHGHTSSQSPRRLLQRQLPKTKPFLVTSQC